MDEIDAMPKPALSVLEWHVSSTGLPTLSVILLATLVALVLVVVLFSRGRGPAVPAAILFLMPLPLIVGLLAFLGGLTSYLVKFANSFDDAPRPDDLSYGLTSAMVASSCFIPLLTVSLILLFIRGLRDSNSPL